MSSNWEAVLLFLSTRGRRRLFAFAIVSPGSSFFFAADLEEAGFSSETKSEGEPSGWLPQGEYNFEADYSFEQVQQSLEVHCS